MYIYIEGKEPVARKSKSLAEMGVKDGDNLIVTTEMKLPYNVYDDDSDIEDENGDDDDVVLALYIGSRQIWAAARWWRHSWENSILPPSLLYLQDNLDEKFSSKIQVQERNIVV